MLPFGSYIYFDDLSTFQESRIAKDHEILIHATLQIPDDEVSSHQTQRLRVMRGLISPSPQIWEISNSKKTIIYPP